MKHRLASLAIAAVLLASLGGTVSAEQGGTPNDHATVASCHGQEVSLLATTGNPPGRSGVNAGTWNKGIKVACATYGG